MCFFVDTVACPSLCSGHGVCRSLREAAGDVDGRVLLADNSYDSVWDADMLYGCVCDVGYTGYDCSLRYVDNGEGTLRCGAPRLSGDVVTRGVIAARQGLPSRRRPTHARRARAASADVLLHGVHGQLHPVIQRRCHAATFGCLVCYRIASGVERMARRALADLV